MPNTKFEIRNRWSGRVEFTAEIECAEDAPIGIKIGLAVRWAYRTRAVLAGAVLTDAVLTGAEIPVIPNIDAEILKAIDAGGKLEMSGWHKCKTTHCRGG